MTIGFDMHVPVRAQIVVEIDGTTIPATDDDLRSAGYWRPEDVFLSVRRGIASAMGQDPAAIVGTGTIGEAVLTLVEEFATVGGLAHLLDEPPEWPVLVTILDEVSDICGETDPTWLRDALNAPVGGDV